LTLPVPFLRIFLGITNNWNFQFTGNNAIIRNVWADLQAGYSWRYDVAANVDIGGFVSNLIDGLKDVQQVVQVVGSIVAAF
jgi:hypothetical protein